MLACMSAGFVFTIIIFVLVWAASLVVKRFNRQEPKEKSNV